MAKKTHNDFDDFDFDSFDQDFDPSRSPDIEEDPSLKGKSRQVVTSAVKGGAEAVKNKFSEPENVKRFALAALPKEYSSIDSTIGGSIKAVKDIKREAAYQLKPKVAKVVKEVDKLIPSKFGGTKNALNKLKTKLGVTDQKTITQRVEQEREAEISGVLGAIFDAQTQTAEKQNAREQINSNIKDKIDETRHNENLGLSRSIDTKLDRLVSYNEQVGISFQRKSLELQYRHLFLQRDLYDVTKKNLEELSIHAKAIVKNTAMPEYVKINEAERFMEIGRNKLYNKAQDFMQRAGGALRKKMGEKIGDYRDAFENAGDALEDLNDKRAMMKDLEESGFKMDKKEMAAGMVVDGLIERYIGKYAGNTKKKLEAGDNKFLQFGLKTDQFLKSASGKARKYSEGESKYDMFEQGAKHSADSWMRSAVGGLLDIIGGGGQTQVLDEGENSTLRGGVYDVNTQDAIVHIMPGYLARILREIQVFRTGDEKIELTTFDKRDRKFTTKSAVTRRIGTQLESMVDKSRQATKTDASIDALLGDKKISASLRKKLKSQISMSSFSDDITRGGVLEKVDVLSDRFLRNFTEQEQEQLRKAVEGNFSEGNKAYKEHQFTSKMESLRKDTGSLNSEIERLYSLGYGSELEELGLVTRENGRVTVNKEAYKKYISGKSRRSGKMPSKGGGVKKTKTTSLRDSSETSEETGLDLDIKDELVSLKETMLSLTEVLGNTTNKDSGSQVQNLESVNYSESFNSVIGLLTEIRDNSKQATVLNASALESIIANMGERFSQGRTDARSLIGKAGDLASDGIKWSSGKAAKLGKFGLGVAGKGLLKTAGLGLTMFGVGKNIVTNADDYIRKPVRGIVGKAGAFLGKSTSSLFEKMNDMFLTKEEREKKAKDKDSSSESEKEDDSPLGIFKKVRDQGFKLVGNVMTSTTNLVSDVFMNKLPAGYGAVLKTVLKAGKAVKGMVDSPVDVYVPGRPDPVLRGEIMKRGGYYDAMTGERILTLGDIKGDVKMFGSDGKDSVVLTVTEMAEGLFDANGRRIGGSLKNMMNKALGLLGKALPGGFRNSKLGKFLGKINPFKMPSYFKDKSSNINIDDDKPIKDIGGDPDAQTPKLLRAILNLLKKRLPNSKRKFNDQDGDGIRKGDWRERLTAKPVKDAAAEKQAAAPPAEKKDRPDVFGMLGGLAGGVFDKAAGLAGSAMDLVESAGALKDAAGTVGDLMGGGQPNQPGRGRLGRFGNSIRGGLGSVGARVAGSLGTTAASNAAGAAGAAGAAASGGRLAALGRGVLTGGRVLGTLAMATTGLSALGGLASVGSGLAAAGAVAATVGGAILTVLSSPVTLAVGAVAAVGYAGYKAYQYFSRNDSDWLTDIRLRQYGLSKADSDNYHYVFNLEGYLLKNAIGYKGNSAYIMETRLDAKEVLSIFGISEEDVTAVGNLLTWLDKRFKPIFLTHLTALMKIDDKLKLPDIRKLDDENKLKFLNAVAFPNGPYDIVSSPISGIEKLTVGRVEVAAEVENLRQDLMKKTKTSSPEKAEVAKAEAGSTTPKSVVLDGTDPSKPEVKLPKFVNKEEDTWLGKSVGFLKGVGSGIVDGASSIGAKIFGKDDPNVPEVAGAPNASGVANVTGAYASVNREGAKQGGNEADSPGPTNGTSATPKEAVEGPKAPAAVPMAAGSMATGGNGDKYISIGKDADISGVHPKMWEYFKAMAEEYGTLTGKKLSVNEAFRSRARQEELYRKYPDKAAKPGSSTHEFGLALDVASKDMNELEKMGLLKKYGFTRPIGGELWHTEMAAVQSNLPGAKNNATLATQLIDASPGRGGGGYATVPGAILKKRNHKVAMALLDAAPKEVKLPPPPEAPNLPAAKPLENKSTSGSGGFYDYGQDRLTAKDAVAASSQTAAPPAMGKMVSSVKSSVNTGAMDSEDGGTNSKGAAGPQGAKGAEGVTGSGGRPQDSSILAIIDKAAKDAGVDRDTLRMYAAIESDFNPNAGAGTSTAKGLMQFVDKTWESAIAKHGAKYGIKPGTSPYDPYASAVLGAEYMKENLAKLKDVRPNPTVEDAYVSHFLGPGSAQYNNGAYRFFRLDKDEIAAEALPAAARANRNIFYDKNKPRNAAGVYAEIQKRMESRSKRYNISYRKAPGFGSSGGGEPTNLTTEGTGDVGASSQGFAESTRNLGGGYASTTDMGSMDVSAPKEEQGSVGGMLKASYNPGGAYASPTKEVSTGGVDSSAQYPTRPMGDVPSELLGSLDGTLKQLLDIDKDSLEVLKSILKAVSTGSNTSNAQQAPPPAENQSSLVEANASPVDRAGTYYRKKRNSLVDTNVNSSVDLLRTV